jgi:hypothetical protein
MDAIVVVVRYKGYKLGLARIFNPILVSTLLAMALRFSGLDGSIPRFLNDGLKWVGGMSLPLLVLDRNCWWRSPETVGAGRNRLKTSLYRWLIKVKMSLKKAIFPNKTDVFSRRITAYPIFPGE